MCFGLASDWIAADPNLRTYGVWAYGIIILFFFGGSAAGAKILICAAREGLPDVPTVRHKADSSYLGLHSTIIQLHVQYMYMVPGSTNLCYQTMATRIYYRIESVRRKPLSRWFDLYFRTSQTP